MIILFVVEPSERVDRRSRRVDESRLRAIIECILGDLAFPEATLAGVVIDDIENDLDAGRPL